VSARAAIATGLRRATRWRLLLLCVLLTAIPAALATHPLFVLLHTLLARAPRAELLATGMEGSWLPDLAHALGDLPQAHALPQGILAALLVALLFGPALSGAIVAESASERPLRLRELLSAMGSWYGRMLRTAIVAVIPLGLAGAAAGAISKGTGKAVSRMVTESAATSRGHLALTAIGVIAVVAHLTLDAGRARMAARPERRSALLAWLSGTWLVARHPVQSAAIAAAGLALGPVLALGVMAVRERLPAGPTWAIVASVLLAQVAAGVVGWGRAVRVAALTRLAGEGRGERLSVTLPPR
jgi:hypothetical protein